MRLWFPRRNYSSCSQNKKMKSSTQDKAEGTAKNISGSVKEATGKLIGNPEMEAAGKAEKVDGQIQEKVGEVKKVLGK
jgi:uncharacterized protein YjbJ (UPF0337 family)